MTTEIDRRLPARLWTTREVDVDPTTLLVDVMVRHDSRLNDDFCASIAEHGVLVPIVGACAADGALRAHFGHRRTLATVKAGRATVFVYVVADERTDDEATVKRLVTQWACRRHPGPHQVPGPQAVQLHVFDPASGRRPG